MRRRRHGRAADTEDDLALGEHDLDLLFTEQPLDLTESLACDQHFLAFREHAHTLEVAHREPVRVRGHQAQAAGGGRQQHSRQDRPSVVPRRGWNDLTECVRERAGGNLHTVSTRLGQTREVRGRQRTQRRPEPPCFDARLVIGELHRHGARIELVHDLREQSCRHDRAAFTFRVRRRLYSDRQLEIGPYELDARRRG